MPGELSDRATPRAEVTLVSDPPPNTFPNPAVTGLAFLQGTDQKGNAGQRQSLFPRSASTDHSPHGLRQVFLEHFFFLIYMMGILVSALRSFSMTDYMILSKSFGLYESSFPNFKIRSIKPTSSRRCNNQNR